MGVADEADCMGEQWQLSTSLEGQENTSLQISKTFCDVSRLCDLLAHIMQIKFLQFFSSSSGDVIFCKFCLCQTVHVGTVAEAKTNFPQSTGVAHWGLSLSR